jgi:hypothetical protein
VKHGLHSGHGVSVSQRDCEHVSIPDRHDLNSRIPIEATDATERSCSVLSADRAVSRYPKLLLSLTNTLRRLSAA